MEPAGLGLGREYPQVSPRGPVWVSPSGARGWEIKEQKQVHSEVGRDGTLELLFETVEKLTPRALEPGVEEKDPDRR